MSTTNKLPTGPQSISLQTASEMTARYRKNKEAILAPSARGQDILCDSETFNRQAIDRLLALTGCEGLRIYYGMDETLKVHAIIVGVNDANEDMLNNTAATAPEDDTSITEEGQRCPPLCAPASPLNS